jgi:hypothetical protein
MRYEVFMTVKMKIAVLRVITPSRYLGGYENFGGTYEHHPHGKRWRRYVPPKC